MTATLAAMPALGLALAGIALAAPIASADCDNYGNQVLVGSTSNCTVNTSYCDGTGGSGAGSGAGAGAGGGVDASSGGAQAHTSAGTTTNCCSGTENCGNDGVRVDTEATRLDAPAGTR